MSNGDGFGSMDALQAADAQALARRSLLRLDRAGKARFNPGRSPDCHVREEVIRAPSPVVAVMREIGVMRDMGRRFLRNGSLLRHRLDFVPRLRHLAAPTRTP